jgi:malonyl-CoA decarboxylase
MGVSFGNFLIKQVVEEVSREMPKLSTFVTLSPVTSFADWLRRERVEEKSAALTEADKTVLLALDQPGWWRDEKVAAQVQDAVMRAAAWYYVRARNTRGTPIDTVARFHLGNGARLERINWLADTSDRAITQADGLMVNYLYDLDEIEKNHEAYADSRTVVASGAVQRLLRPPLELVPIAG